MHTFEIKDKEEKLEFYIYIYVSLYPVICSYVKALWCLPNDRMPMVKLKTVSFDEERNTDRPITYWLLKHGTKHDPWTDVLILKFRPASFLKTFDTNYPITWHHIWVEPKTIVIMRLMNCLLILTVIYTILMIIPIWMAIQLFRYALPWSKLSIKAVTLYSIQVFLSLWLMFVYLFCRAYQIV
jgi:hypothetical protein